MNGVLFCHSENGSGPIRTQLPSTLSIFITCSRPKRTHPKLSVSLFKNTCTGLTYGGVSMSSDAKKVTSFLTIL